MKEEVIVNVHIMRHPIIMFERFSKWKKLVRCMGYVYRFIGIIKSRAENTSPPAGYLTSTELSKAEQYIIRRIQHDSYPSEMKDLQRDQKQYCVDIKSKIYNLSPVMIDGILRIKGRTGAIMNRISDIPSGLIPAQTNQPIILSHDHYATALLVRSYHEKYWHLHHETVVNEMHQLYHIPRLRQLLKKIVKSCAGCKYLTAKPVVPEMADLPQARLMLESQYRSR